MSRTSMPIPTLRSILTFSLGAAFALGLAACGSEGDLKVPPGASVPAGTSAPAGTSKADIPGATPATTPPLAVPPGATATPPLSTPQPATPPATTAPPPPRGPLGAGSIALAPAFGGRTWDRPIEVVAYPGGDYLVADQSGLVLRVAADGRDLGTFLDQRSVTLRAGNEEGLLSVALDPAFTSNRYVYTYASRGNPRRSVLFRYTVTSSETVDPASELTILEFPQPFANHNGGAIRFGPDGMLYLGLGDGGSSGDPGNRAQNLQELLGKVIRLDVRGATAGAPYRPAGDAGLTSRGARPEIWAYGFRNPWRMAFDPVSGGLFAGDVGQNRIEEVDRVVGGGNYGWPILEGNDCYRPSSNCPREGLTAPLAAYPQSEGGSCSVTGGLVMDAQLIYADFCSGRIWAVPIAGGSPVLLLDTNFRVASFAPDHEGTILAIPHGAAIQRIVRVR